MRDKASGSAELSELGEALQYARITRHAVQDLPPPLHSALTFRREEKADTGRGRRPPKLTPLASPSPVREAIREHNIPR